MDKNSLEIYTKIVEVVTQSSFDLWKDQNFRALLDFDNLDQTEQDRIFNELEVTALGLSILQADTYPKLKNFDKQMIEAFLDLMRDSGVEEKFLKDWKVLIDLRLKEYREDYDLTLKNSESWKDQIDTEALRFIWARVESQSIIGFSHIRKGKIDTTDPLWKIIRKWLVVLDLVFSQIISKNPFKVSPQDLN